MNIGSNIDKRKRFNFNVSIEGEKRIDADIKREKIFSLSRCRHFGNWESGGTGIKELDIIERVSVNFKVLLCTPWELLIVLCDPTWKDWFLVEK